MQYLPASQLSTWCCMYSVVRTEMDPMSLEPEARSIVTSMDRDIPVTTCTAMQDLIWMAAGAATLRDGAAGCIWPDWRWY